MSLGLCCIPRTDPLHSLQYVHPLPTSGSQCNSLIKQKKGPLVHITYTILGFTEDVWEHVGDNWISMGGVTEMSWNRDVDEAEMYRQRTPDIVELPPMAGGMF